MRKTTLFVHRIWRSCLTSEVNEIMQWLIRPRRFKRLWQPPPNVRFGIRSYRTILSSNRFLLGLMMSCELAGRIRVFHCRPRFVSLTKSSGYHGPVCQLIRLNWPAISSEKPLCATPGETGLAVVLSRPRLTHRAIRVGMLIVDERPETNPYSWTGGSLMFTSSMGCHTCST